MSQETVIQTTFRDALGKNAVKKLHQQGQIPAVVYGRNFAPLSLSVDAAVMNKMFKSGSEDSTEFHITKLQIDNKGDVSETMVIVKDMQRHPVKNNIQHIDFFVVRMDEKITAPVHIRLHGKAEGVKLGGIMRQILREVDVRGLPTDIPAHFDIEVSAMQIGDAIHVSDLEVSDKVQIQAELNAPIVNILTPTIHAEEEPAEGEEEEEAAAETEDEKAAEKKAEAPKE